MNPLILVICALLIFSLPAFRALNRGKYQNDLVDENLKGKVKWCIEYFYDTPKSGDGIDSDYTDKFAEEFNLLGNYIANIASGNPAKKPTLQGFGELFTYDSVGREVTILDLSHSNISTSVYSENKRHNLVETMSDSQTRGYKIVYNNQGLRDTFYDVSSRLGPVLKITYRYNKNNDLVEETWFKENRMKQSSIVRAYDDGHHKIEEKWCDSLGASDNRITYAYDGLGNLVMETDSNITYAGGNRVFDIDPNNERILIFRCKYSNFDKFNNWLREDMFHKGAIAKTFKRKIEYY